MNTLWKQSGDLRECRLDPFAHQRLVILLCWFNSSLRVLLSAHRKPHAIYFTGGILSGIIRVAAIHKQFTARRQFQCKHIKPSHITCPTMHESKLHRQSGLGRHDMHLHTIEVAPLRSTLAAKLFTLRDAATGYADVVADSYRERVKQ